MKDYVDSGVVLGTDRKIRICRMGRAGVEEKIGVEVLIEAVADIAVESPVIFGVEAAKTEVVGRVCRGCGC